MSNSNVPRSNLEFRPLLRTLAILVLGFNAIPAKAEISAQDMLQHFYRATGGSAWQRFEECDSAGHSRLRAEDRNPSLLREPA